VYSAQAYIIIFIVLIDKTEFAATAGNVFAAASRIWTACRRAGGKWSPPDGKVTAVRRKVTLVGQVDRCCSCNGAVDQRHQLEHNMLTNRQSVELPQDRCCVPAVLNL